uniref:Ferric uptake regulator, Fur family n=1 Tax=Mycobacterium sp. (strain JLS) TaxID=164757 RepID=A0A5Q5CND7_MYCSJ
MTPARETTPEARLRASGLRVTAPRLAVLSALEQAPHSTADDVAKQVREALGKVSTQAIYDVLRACVSAGLVRRIEPAGSSARYETRIGDNHHHLVCRRCGRVADVDCIVGAAPLLGHPSPRGRFHRRRGRSRLLGHMRGLSRGAAGGRGVLPSVTGLA